MVNSILLYIVQNENEIPQQLVPNSGYYLVGREVRIVDNLGQVATFVAPQKANVNNGSMEKYEEDLAKIKCLIEGVDKNEKDD